MTNNNNYIEAAAADFARHIAGGGGWALGLEVASCVQNNGPGGSFNGRKMSPGKVSALEFAKKAGTSAPRVLRYLTAWDKAASTKLVKASSKLKPENWDDIDLLPTGDESWDQFYDASSGVGRNIKDPAEREVLTEEATKRGIGPAKVLDVASNPAAVAAALDASPEFAQKVASKRQVPAYQPTHGLDLDHEGVQEQLRQNRGAQTGLQALRVVTLLSKMKRMGKEALQVDAIPCFTDQEKDFIQHEVDLIEEVLELIKQKHIQMQLNVDWDAEFAKLTGGN